MYIDFRDPAKNTYSKNSEEKPKKKKSLGLFRKEETSKASTQNKSKESIPTNKLTTDKKLIEKKETHKESKKDNLNILEQINQVISKQNSEPNIVTEDTNVTLHKEKDNSLRKTGLTPNANLDENYISPAVPKVGKENFEPFEFKAKTGEYFKIWIVNIALTLLTLGIYSAWAKVRTNRYIYGNTYLNKSNFEYNADPKRIFIGRSIVVLFYATFLLFGHYLNMYKIAAGIFVLFLLLLPWLIRQAISFRLKSASYRNIPFKFHAKVRSFYLLSVIIIVAIIALPILIVFISKMSPELAVIVAIIGYILLFSVIIPILYRRYKALVVNHSSYANAEFSFKATRKDAVKMFIKMGLLTFAVSLIFGAITIAITGMGGTILSYIPTSITHHPMFKYLITIFGMILYLFFTGLYKGISDGYLSNFARNHTSLENAKFKGEINPTALGLISATNAILLVFSLGLLYPYTKLRYLRYKIEHTYFTCDNYDKFISQGYENTNPIGEEAMDFFDIDIGF